MKNRLTNGINHDMHDTLNNEMQCTMKKKNWNALDMCFKWKYVQIYLQNFTWLSDNDILTVKSNLTSKKITNVSYDTKQKCVVKLNIIVNNTLI